MQIHELNTKALTDPAYVAFDDGTDTYKVEFNDTVEGAAQSAVASADLTDNAVAFTSGDAASPTAWANVSVMASGSTLATLMNRISTMVKNVRYIWSKIGSSSISNVSTTITGAIGNTSISNVSSTITGAIGNTSISNVSSTITGAIGNTSISGIGGGTLTGAVSFINRKAQYYSLGSNGGIDSVTTSAVTHTLYANRKFGDYSLLVATIEDTYIRATCVIPRSVFVSPMPISMSWVDSVNTQRWVELSYVSDTSYSVIGSSNADGKYVRLIGLL